jgi:hypothetical protein
MKEITHKHHIIPKHAGGTDDPSNIIELTLAEHAAAHKLLYDQYGRWQDKVAWHGLAKITNAHYLLLSEKMIGENNPMFGKPAPNRGVKRPGVGGRKKGTKWSDKERAMQLELRSKPGHYDYLKDPARAKKISESKKGSKGTTTGRKWYNNGIKQVLANECPIGFINGRISKKQ